MRKKISFIILFILFIVFSFFSCLSYRLLVNQEQDRIKNKLEDRIRKNKEINIIYRPKKEVIYNKENNTKLNYSYYDTNIIIPGNEIASLNMQKQLNKINVLDEKVKKKVKRLETVNKEYALDKEMGIFYSNNKIISFYYKLLGYIEEYEINELNVFSLNINTGVKLQYKDISTNTKRLKSIIKNYIIKKINQEYPNVKNDSISNIDKEMNKENFYLEDENLVVVINRCSLIDCLYGNLFIKIPYKDISDVLIDKYY